MGPMMPQGPPEGTGAPPEARGHPQRHGEHPRDTGGILGKSHFLASGRPHANPSKTLSKQPPQPPGPISIAPGCFSGPGGYQKSLQSLHCDPFRALGFRFRAFWLLGCWAFWRSQGLGGLSQGWKGFSQGLRGFWGAPRGSGGVPVPLGVPPVPSWGPIGPMGGAPPLMGPLGPYRAHVGPLGPYVGPCYGTVVTTLCMHKVWTSTSESRPRISAAQLDVASISCASRNPAVHGSTAPSPSGPAPTGPTKGPKGPTWAL